MADTNFKFCATCGRKVALSAQFCAACGAALGAKEKSVQGTAPTQQELTAKELAHEGAMLYVSKFKFCENCGRKVSLNGQLCARCGADLGAPEEQNVQQDAVTGEVVVGYTSRVVLGGIFGFANGVLLFTTDRTVVAKASSGLGKK